MRIDGLWKVVFMSLVACKLMACSGSVGCFYKPINGMEEKQTYQEKK